MRLQSICKLDRHHNAAGMGCNRWAMCRSLQMALFSCLCWIKTLGEASSLQIILAFYLHSLHSCGDKEAIQKEVINRRPSISRELRSAALQAGRVSERGVAHKHGIKVCWIAGRPFCVVKSALSEGRVKSFPVKSTRFCDKSSNMITK